MKKLIYIMLPALVLFSSGCTKEDTAEDLQDKIIGTWNVNSVTYVDVNPALNVSVTNAGVMIFSSTTVTMSTGESQSYSMVSGTEFSMQHPVSNGTYYTAYYTVSEITDNSFKFSGAINDAFSGTNGTATYVLSK